MPFQNDRKKCCVKGTGVKGVIMLKILPARLNPQERNSSYSKVLFDEKTKPRFERRKASKCKLKGERRRKVYWGEPRME